MICVGHTKWTDETTHFGWVPTSYRHFARIATARFFKFLEITLNMSFGVWVVGFENHFEQFIIIPGRMGALIRKIIAARVIRH